MAKKHFRDVPESILDWSKYPNWIRPDKRHLRRRDNGCAEKGKTLHDGDAETRP